MHKQQHYATAALREEEHSADFETPEALSDTLAQLENLRNRPERWNGHDVAASNLASIALASTWLQSFFADVEKLKQFWIKPYVTTDEDGNVVFEWINGQKDWMVTISPTEVRYLREDATKDDEPETGRIQSSGHWRDLWTWLRS